ncbi:MAG: dTMP kinase [Bacteroidia bacterium]|nr:dTMP kinase [Bacteroidia bacterium]
MFISFEGIDFCGKTTQIERLASIMEKRGERCLLVREPGGTVLSEQIRAMLLDKGHIAMHAVTELLLFSAARSQLVQEIIIPALQRGEHVIADRFFDSTTAYQGFGRGLDIERILSLHDTAAHGIIPDRTLFIDISVEESFRRRVADGRATDRMEQADFTFFERVRNGYHALARRYPGRITLLDGMQSIDAIAHRIESLLSSPEKDAMQ